MSERLKELAHRLVASGAKAAHVSCSETHEISEGLIDALEENEKLKSNQPWLEVDWKANGAKVGDIVVFGDCIALLKYDEDPQTIMQGEYLSGADVKAIWRLNRQAQSVKGG